MDNVQTCDSYNNKSRASSFSKVVTLRQGLGCSIHWTPDANNKGPLWEVEGSLPPAAKPSFHAGSWDAVNLICVQVFLAIFCVTDL
jgi:hypothetical protein